MKKYQKVIKLILLFSIVVIIVISLSKTIFKKYHHINYEIINDNNNFNIEETYQDKRYYLSIKINKNTFPFININNYRKRKKIIQNIIYYYDNKIICIMPIYKKDFDNEMLCQKDQQLLTYSSIKDYAPLNKYIDKIKDKYPHPSFIDSNKTVNYQDYQVYQNNIMPGIYLMKWNYKGLDIFSNNYQRINILNYDLYTNKLGILVNNKYLQADINNKSFSFKQFYIIDIITGKKKILKMDYSISFDAYINGVIANKVYLFDRDNLTQYEIDIAKKKVIIIGDKNTNGKYYDGSWHKINIFDLKKEELLFKETKDESYYYKDSTMYRQINNQEIILFTMKEISNIIIKEDYIYFIKDNAIYGYNEKYGLKKILVNNELTFNKNNIFDFYIKN